MTALSETQVAALWSRSRAVVEKALEELLPAATVAPVSLHEAMRWSVLAGGKRLRPAAAGGDEGHLDAGAALEHFHDQVR